MLQQSAAGCGIILYIAVDAAVVQFNLVVFIQIATNLLGAELLCEQDIG